MGKSFHIDLGEDEVVKPLEGRPHVAFLLGAGFSAPLGYPIGNTVNNALLKFHEEKIDFSPCGTLCTSSDGSTSSIYVGTFQNDYQRAFVFCKRLIKAYAVTKAFDYEQFYDFIKSPQVYDEQWEHIADDIVSENCNYRHLVFLLPTIYNQMVAHLIKDSGGCSWYDNLPFHIGRHEHYDGLLNYIKQIKNTHIVNIHTLNHDLVFESLQRTEYINGDLSDGFDEYGSNYYGNLEVEGRNYHCRLERYKGRYNTAIRLFKLHGSLDYVLFYRRDKAGFMTPENYVKIRHCIGPGNIFRSVGSKMRYEDSPFEYHADFLTGTTSKIRRYSEPILFKKLLQRFKANLKKSKKVIIIGYGFKDEEINNMLIDNYSQDKSVIIVDPYPSETVNKYVRLLNAKLIVKPVNQLAYTDLSNTAIKH